VYIDRFTADYTIEGEAVVKRAILDDDSWGLLLSHQLALVLRIKGRAQKVGDLYYAENPFTVSEAYEFQKLLIDLKGAAFDSSQYVKFVNTGTIEKYHFLWSVEPTTYLKRKYHAPVVDQRRFKRMFPKRFAQMNMPKVIISGMRHFECAPDSGGNIIAGKSTVILKSKDAADLNIVLAILNSTLMSFYIQEAFGVLGIGGGINFTAGLVEGLPLPTINGEYSRKLGDLVRNILKVSETDGWLSNSSKRATVLDCERKIDQLVYRLYGVTSEEIELMERSRRVPRDRRAVAPTMAN
jgi:hypothetical protein